MVIDRIFTPGLAQVAYLVADEASGDAAVIDPRRDIAAYLDWASAHHVRITAILETHVHADFVSGARELAAATGATIYAGRLGQTAFPHQPLDDGDEVAIGRLRLRALWTPGHTPEHLAYLLLDPTQGAAPVALFSGDVLFTGEIGRPDLLGPAAQQTLINQLYDTVEHRLKPLPDDLVVYPGHTAGSPCGKQIGTAPHTTIGAERAGNYAFNQPGREAFVRSVMAGMPRPPAYYPVMKRINAAGPALLGEMPVGGALAPQAVQALQAEGALVIDARPASDFAAGHIPAAVSLPLGPNFAIWAGWLTPYGRPVALMLSATEEYDIARTELRRIGIDDVAGFLAGGMAAWEAAGFPTAHLTTISVAELAANPGGYRLLDVRDRAEYAAGHVAGASAMPAGDLAQGTALPPGDGRPTALLCGSGYRSGLAASLLQGLGAADIVNVAGGMAAWQAAGLPLAPGAPARAENLASAASIATPQAETLPLEMTAAEYLAAPHAAPLRVLDVREPDEWQAGHLHNASLIPLGDLPARLPELDHAATVVTVCRSGRRSLEAARFLRAHGYPWARSLAGGMIAWEAAGQPVTRA